MGATSAEARDAHSGGREAIAIPLGGVVESNCADLAKMQAGPALAFCSAEPAPPGAAYHYVRYAFDLPAAGRWRVRIETERGQRGFSDLSCAVDDLPARQMVHRRVVGQPRGWRESPEAIPLEAGRHTLELRFARAQRVRIMNRVSEDYERHRVTIYGIRIVPEGARRPAGGPIGGTRLCAGDRVVFFGDSITDEELYPGHVARIAGAAFPGAEIEFVNSGISLNRACDGLARLEADVIALRPSWAVVCFGVNDAMQKTPAEFERDMNRILARLDAAGIRVICATPPGFHGERFPDCARYFHTPDRIAGIDHTAAQMAEAVVRLAREHRALCADALGALRGVDLPLDRLMANQWHPNSEGGRLMALAILRALGLEEADAARTGDAKDREYFRMLAHVPAPGHPRYVVPEVEGRGERGPLVAVSSFADNTVVLYSREGRRVAKVPVGAHPGGLAYASRRGELYVVCEGEGVVRVVDRASCEVTSTIALDDDDYPTCIALNRAQDTAWVGTYYGSRLVEIDLREKRIRRSVPIDGFAQAVALLEDQYRILVATLQGIVVVDEVSGKVTGRIPVEYVGAFLPLDGGRIGAIDTVYWQMHVLALPDGEVVEVCDAPAASRAVARDAQGAVWEGDWKTHRLVRKGPADAASLVAEGEVAFPFGIAFIDR